MSCFFLCQSAVPTLRCQLRAPRFPLSPGSVDHVALSQCFSHAVSGSYHLLILHFSPSRSFLSHTLLIQANVSLSYSSLDSIVSNVAQEPRLIFCSLFELNILPSLLNLLWAFLWPEGLPSLVHALVSWPTWLRFFESPVSLWATFVLLQLATLLLPHHGLLWCSQYSSPDILRYLLISNSPRSGWRRVRDGDSIWERQSYQVWIVFIILWGWEADWPLLWCSSTQMHPLLIPHKHNHAPCSGITNF